MSESKPMLQKLLSLNLQNLTPEEVVWLHHLKNLATAMQGRLQLKALADADSSPSNLDADCQHLRRKNVPRAGQHDGDTFLVDNPTKDAS